jgi:phytoene dehydrogenase-like protein
VSTPLLPGGTTPGRHVYDAIVVGGHLGAAYAAALLSRRGLKTLLVPHDGLGQPYAHGGFRFTHGPALVPPMRAVAPLGRAAAELGLGPRLEAQLRQPPLQLLRAGCWFELKVDEKERATELKRALRTQAEAFSLEQERAVAAVHPSDAFFEAGLDFPPEGLLARWRFTRQLPRFTGLATPSPLPAEALLRLLLPFAAPVERPAPLTEARALGQLLAGPSVALGGREGLYQVLADRARELGADVVAHDEAVESLVLQGSAVAGVRLKHAGATFRAAAVVAGTDLEVLTRLVPEARRGPARKALALLGAPRALLTLHAVLPDAGLPRGLGPLALIPREGLAGLLLEVTPARSAGAQAAPPGLRTLSVSTVVPAAARASEAAVRLEVEALWSALQVVMPFTRRHVQLESVPWLHARGVAEGLAEPWPLFSTPPDAWFGVTGLPTQPAWSRLLLASRQVFPGLGLEGELLAATRAVERVERLTAGQRRKAG